MTQAYPLQWPDFIPRSTRREGGKFKTTLPAALQNVRDSLRLFGSDSGKPVADIVLSSNVSLGPEKPADPGIAVWFKWDGEQRCIPVDRYMTPAANLQAIHHIVEARRVELRHGTLALVRAPRCVVSRPCRRRARRPGGRCCPSSRVPRPRRLRPRSSASPASAIPTSPAAHTS